MKGDRRWVDRRHDPGQQLPATITFPERNRVLGYVMFAARQMPARIGPLPCHFGTERRIGADFGTIEVDMSQTEV
jgi:hypothetical protein